MRYYLLLRMRSAVRALEETGLPALPALVLALGAALLFALALYRYTAAADAVVLVLGCIAAARGIRAGRLEFLDQQFGPGRRVLIRLAENLLMTFPFLAVLLVAGAYAHAAALTAVAIALSPLKPKRVPSIVLPTPFGRHPWEFILLVRTFWPLIPLLYALVWAGWRAGNPNLCAAACGALYLLALMAFPEPEPALYVWMYRASPGEFLWLKLRRAAGQAALLVLPAALFTALVFPRTILLLSIIVCAGTALLSAVLLAKYASFPERMHVGATLLITLGFWFPPLFLFIVPFLFAKARRTLQPLLSPT